MRILFIQLKQLGDVLMTTPLIKAFNKNNPKASIDYLVNKKCVIAIETNPHIGRILIYDDKSFFNIARQIRSKKYDAVVDCQCLPKTAFLSFFSGAKIRTGFKKRGRGLFYSHSIPVSSIPIYSAMEKSALLEPFYITVDDIMPELYILPSDKEDSDKLISQLKIKDSGRVLAFSPVSRRDYKMWPLERYAEACDILFEKHGLKFLPLFGPGEEKTINKVISLSKHPETFLFPYKPPSFRALKMLIKECLFYFGNDNGIRHIAIAAGLPTASIFSEINPITWTPPLMTMHKSVWGKDGIEKIAVNEVITMVEQVLENPNPLPPLPFDKYILEEKGRGGKRIN